jgi:hypothetical protein
MYQSCTLNETKRCDTETTKHNETVPSGHGTERNVTKRKMRDTPHHETERNGKQATRQHAKRNETENFRHGISRNETKRKLRNTGKGAKRKDTERPGTGNNDVGAAAGQRTHELRPGCVSIRVRPR